MERKKKFLIYGGVIAVLVIILAVLLVVALKGDINLNGGINAADSVLISRSKLSSSASAYRALSTLEEVLADINNSGSVNAADAMLINRANLSSSASAYTALTW